MTLMITPSWILAGLTKPQDGSELNFIHVLFEWDEVENAAGYDFQLSPSEDFSSPLVNTTITELYYIEKNVIEWESNYYWRVKSEGDQPGWMGPSGFSTGKSSVIFQGDDKPIEILTYNSQLASN